MSSTDDRKFNPRREFLDIAYGEAKATKTLLSRLEEQFQPGVLNNQFVKTEATSKEIQAIREFYSNAVLEIAGLMDFLVELDEKEYKGE